MSSINSLLGNSASTSTGSSSSSSSTTTSTLNQLTPNDFIKFMVTQLENQDPLNPTDSSQMLTQMSQIGQLQASDTLQTDLTSMVQQNQVAAASSMIGKAVQGTDGFSNAVSGNVTAVQVTTKSVNLTLDTGSTVSLANVSSITNPAGSTGSASTGSGSAGTTSTGNSTTAGS